MFGGKAEKELIEMAGVAAFFRASQEIAEHQAPMRGRQGEQERGRKTHKGFGRDEELER